MSTGVIDHHPRTDVESLPAFEQALMRFGHRLAEPFRAAAHVLAFKLYKAKSFSGRDITVGSAVAGSFAAGAALVGGMQVSNTMSSATIYEALHSGPAIAQEVCSPVHHVSLEREVSSHHRAPNVPITLIAAREAGDVRKLDVARYGRAKRRSDEARTASFVESVVGGSPEGGAGRSDPFTRAPITREMHVPHQS